MSRIVEEDAPGTIRTHPANEAYLKNYDAIDWGDDEPAVKNAYSCSTCCDTGCVIDPHADESTFVTESDGLMNCPECSIRRNQLP